MRTRDSERGFAMMMAIFVIVVVAGLCVAMTSSSAVEHSQAMQSTDRARSLALADGAATLLISDLSDDPLAPVKDTTNYTVDGDAYTRTFTPFQAADGQARIELRYLHDVSGTRAPFLFLDRTAPREAYTEIRATVTGIRPTANRAIEIDFEPTFVLFKDAIVTDAIPLSSSGSNKSLAMDGNIVFNDKGRPGQFFVNGDIAANGGIYDGTSSYPLHTYNANSYFDFAGTVNSDLAGTSQEIPDYTNPGSTDQLFDFGRVIAAARAGAGQEYTTFADFKTAMNTANTTGKPLEGITVLSIDPKTWGSDHMEPTDIPGGINIRGTLVFNFVAGTAATYKIWVELPFSINAADLSGLVPSDPTTYTTGYGTPYKNPSKKPSAVDIGPTYQNFTDKDDLPALMFNTGIVDQHGACNICGLIYGPSFVELENKQGNIQYFNGSIMGGTGVYVEGNGSTGYTVIAFDPNTIDQLATNSSDGKGLRIISWRTVD